MCQELFASTESAEHVASQLVALAKYHGERNTNTD